MDISMIRGDRLSLILSSIKLSDGSEYELSDTDRLYFDVKKSPAERAVIHKEITAADRTESGYPMNILPEDTAELVCGDYRFDIRLYVDSENIYTIIPDSKLKIMRNITDIPENGEG